MAKFYLSYKDQLEQVSFVIESEIRNTKNHTIAVYEKDADYIIHLDQDSSIGDESVIPYIYDNILMLKDIGDNIRRNFEEYELLVLPTKIRHFKFEEETIRIPVRVGRINQAIDAKLYGTLIAKGILNYFEPNHSVTIKQSKKKEKLVKRQFDKDSYSRNFNQSPTNNVLRLFKN